MSNAEAPSYLLIEGYASLAEAIKIALQKFAPSHAAHIAADLDAARKIVHATRPALIIIDFDPPPPGTISFLEEVRGSNRDTHVLLLAPGVPNEIVSERGGSAGLHFIEKPFDLTAFGAEVRALLEAANSGGCLRDLSVADGIMLGCLGGLSAMIEVKQDKADCGTLHFSNGRLRHAATSSLNGREALIEMLGWRDVNFGEAGLPASGQRSFTADWTATLKEALCQAKAPAAPAPQKTQKVLIIDDTETLLLLVVDSLAMANPELEIVTAVAGKTGLEEARRQRPDLVIVDYSIPDLRGDQICQHLLAAAETARIPVIMMSGHVPEMERSASSFRNIVGTIAKPFVSDALTALALKTLERGPLAERPAEIPVPKFETIIVPPPPPAPAPPPPPPENEVMLDLPLDVVAMQFNSDFQIGSIRARVAPTAAIQFPALAARASLPRETGFQLGDVDLDSNGQLSLVRLLPTTQPFHPVNMNGAFAVNGTAVVPANDQERLQLMSSADSAMTMQLFAPLELVAVDLNAFLEVRQLVLRCRSNAVRVTLNSTNSEVKNGALFRTDAIALDETRHIRELTLRPTEL